MVLSREFNAAIAKAEGAGEPKVSPLPLLQLRALGDVPADVCGQLRFHPVESVDEVLAPALVAPIAPSAAA